MSALWYNIGWEGEKPVGAPSVARFYVPPRKGGLVIVKFRKGKQTHTCKVTSVVPIALSGEPSTHDYAANIKLKMLERSRRGVVVE